MEKVIKKIFAVVFIFVLVFFMIGTLTNNNEISDVERRNLQTFPKFSIKNILDKDYYDDLTSAFSDQLALRNYLVKGYFLFNFQSYLGDVAVGSNKQLYSAVQDRVDDSYYNELKVVTERVNASSKTNAKFIFLSIPRKDAYMTKDLPSNYISSKDIYEKSVDAVKETLDNDIIFIDAMEVFTENNIYNCYYSNDHHITPRCAYLLYKEINKYTDTDSYDLDSMFEVKQTVVNGAYNRQLGQTVKSDPEDLYLVLKNNNINWTRYENSKKSNKKIYGVGDNYEDAYMEGDNAYTKIITNVENGKNIMFVGSSFTNILEALSVPSYNKVVSIDYRHNKEGKTINDYVLEEDIDYIVFVPSQSVNAFSIYAINEHLGK